MLLSKIACVRSFVQIGYLPSKSEEAFFKFLLSHQKQKGYVIVEHCRIQALLHTYDYINLRGTVLQKTKAGDGNASLLAPIRHMFATNPAT